MSNLLLRSIIRSRDTTLSLVNDVTDADWTRVPRGISVHPAFVLGHIDLFDVYALMALSDRPVPIDRVAGLNAFGPTSSVYSQPDRYMTRAEIVKRLSDRREIYRTVLTRCNAQAWDRENPHEELRSEFPTVGDLLAYVPCHESVHAEELVRWRDLCKYPFKPTRLFKP